MARDTQRLARGDRPRVVVIGGGFGGMQVAKGLRTADAEVMLVDRVNHHLFQPLLYQVATGLLSPGDIAPALRSVFARQHNVRVVLGEATSIEPERSRLTVVAPDGGGHVVEFDHLVLATGAQSSFFGHEEWAEFAAPMKTLADAIDLRDRLLSAFELAAVSEDAEVRRDHLTFVVVGAGPTGVEVAGQIAALARRTLKREFHDLDASDIRVVVVDAGDTVLHPFAPSLQHHATESLERLGIELMLGHAVSAVDDDGITVKPAHGHDHQARRLRAHTVVWAAGVATSPLAHQLSEATGASVDHRGRIEVGPHCELPGHPHIFAIGDAAQVDDLPGLAEPAMQEGRHVAEVIRCQLTGHVLPGPFRYRDLGTMATISPTDAVAQRGRLRVSGIPAKAGWAAVHLAFLVGWGNRLSVLTSWTRIALFGSRGRQLIIRGSRGSMQH